MQPGQELWVGSEQEGNLLSVKPFAWHLEHLSHDPGLAPAGQCWRDTLEPSVTLLELRSVLSSALLRECIVAYFNFMLNPVTCNVGFLVLLQAVFCLVLTHYKYIYIYKFAHVR